MKTLVYAEHRDGKFKNAVLETIGAASKLGEVDAVIICETPEAANLGAYGVGTVHQINEDALKSFTPEGYSQALAQVAKSGGYDLFFAPASARGKDIMPRVAAILGTAMISEVTEILNDGGAPSFKRPIYSGKVFQNVSPEGDSPSVVTVRPNVFPVPEAGSGSAEVKPISGLELTIRSIVKEVTQGAGGKIDLSEANIVVSGGRSLKSEDNFKILDDLANVLGGAVGASRAAVDAGFAPHSMQVGQTGKTVSPTLYIACGISGAIQHLAGMRTSKVIVAINTDENAPIFQKADYGIVGDLFEVVPLLTEEFKRVLQ